MNSIHDMGGMHGFGPVEEEAKEPVFHEEWEGRVLAMQRALGVAGLWTIDMSRASQEALPPQQYLAASYYERWYLGLKDRVVRHGLATEEELAAGHRLQEGPTLSRTFTATDVPNMRRSDFNRQASAQALFAPGDSVRTRNINPTTHTRLPRYARGKVGTVEAVRGCHVYPDTVAISAGENPQWLYTVVFSGTVLWGPECDPSMTVSIEAFEPYLEKQ